MPKPPTVMSILQLEPLKYGSKEEYMVFLSRALQKRGWKSILVFERPVPESIRPYFDGTGAVLEFYQDGSRLRRYADIFRILVKYRPEAVHFHFFNHFTILPILAWLAGPKVVVFTDELRQPNRLSLVTRLECLFWDRVVLPLLGTKVLAVSDYIKRTLVTCYGMSPKRIRVVYNGVNVERFTPLHPDEQSQIRRELGIPSDRPFVVCASHLRPEKGIGDLLRAAEIVLGKRPEVFFGILGEGPSAEELRAKAKQLGIESCVRFFGQRSDVNRFMAVADIVAVPSAKQWQDPAPFTVIEGMAMGRPVVATRVGGIPEYLADGATGLLVEPNSPPELASALIRLLDSPAEAEAMGRAGRERAMTYFSVEKCVQETLEVFDEAMGRKRK